MSRILSFLLLTLSFLAVNAQKQKSVDPSYLFNSLMDCPTEQSMADICTGNDLTEQASENGFRKFRNSDGTTICFRLDSVNPRRKIPVIEVTTKQSTNKLKKVLDEMGYKKEGDQYVKGTSFSTSKSVCTLSSGNKGNTLTCTRIYKD